MGTPRRRSRWKEQRPEHPRRCLVWTLCLDKPGKGQMRHGLKGAFGSQCEVFKGAAGSLGVGDSVDLYVDLGSQKDGWWGFPALILPFPRCILI